MEWFGAIMVCSNPLLCHCQSTVFFLSNFFGEAHCIVFVFSPKYFPIYHIPCDFRRVALHRYDPVDLQESFAAAQEVATSQRQIFSQITPTGADDTTLTVKEKEIANSGLVDLVQVTLNSNSAGYYNSPSRRLELDSSTTSERNDVMEQDHATRQGGILSELDRWEAARQENEDELHFSGGEDDDSDDDLL